MWETYPRQTKLNTLEPEYTWTDTSKEKSVIGTAIFISQSASGIEMAPDPAQPENTFDPQ